MIVSREKIITRIGVSYEALEKNYLNMLSLTSDLNFALTRFTHELPSPTPPFGRRWNRFPSCEHTTYIEAFSQNRRSFHSGPGY